MKPYRLHFYSGSYYLQHYRSGFSGFMNTTNVSLTKINGKQCTIIWYVDDLKISHIDPKVVNNIIKRLEEKFGQESPLVTLQGKTVEYLGMCIDYTVKGKVKISMYDYIDKMLAELPSDMNGVSTTPAALHLFNVDDSAEKLDEDNAQLFHHLVTKLLYLS